MSESLWGMFASLKEQVSEFTSALVEENKDTVQHVKDTAAGLIPSSESGSVEESNAPDASESLVPVQSMWNILGSFSKSVEQVASSLSAMGESFSPEQSEIKEESIPLDSRRAKIILMISHDESFLEIEPFEEEFVEFSKRFSLETSRDQIDRALQDFSPLMTKLALLVPSKIEAGLFWQRFFFRVLKIDQEIENQQKLLSKLKPSKSQSDEMRWEDDTEKESPDDKPHVDVQADLETKSDGNGELDKQVCRYLYA